MPASLLRYSLCLVGLLTVTLSAQTPATNSDPAQNTQPEKKRATRTMSPELAATLTAGIKYEAPPAEKKKEEEVAAAVTEAEETDLRETDKPRNTIIRLPKYVIQGERPPVFTERDLHTQKGLADLAVKRYLSAAHQSLNKYHLPHIMGGMSSEDLAMMMYLEDERLRNMQDVNDKVYLYRTTGDTEEADRLKQDAASTFIRRSDLPDAPRANGK
jgi:hypothetical protein